MKTDPRAYNGVLTAELADFAAKQGMDANDVYIYVCKNLRPKGDNMEKREHACDFVEFVDPEYVQRWVKNNVKYPEGTLLKSGGKTYCHIKYHGKYATAKELSELTGLRPNTIYVYWAKCEKDLLSRETGKKLLFPWQEFLKMKTMKPAHCTPVIPADVCSGC